MSSGEIWVTMFGCCVAPENTVSGHRHHRPRIDRSMIGNPTDFRHTAHIGSADLSTGSTTGNISTRRLAKIKIENEKYKTINTDRFLISCLF